MAEHHSVSREALQAEAQLLGELIEQHQEDLQAVRDGRRFIYFIDAHELKSYLSANDREKMEGFIFNVEKILESRGIADDVQSRVRLKAEQIQRSLLIEQPNDLLLFPSHAEEMDEELAFIAQGSLTQDYDLAGIARQQWAALLKQGVSRKDLSQLSAMAIEGDATSKRRLLKVLTSEVPALVGLLFPAADSLKGRLETLLSHSRVSLLAQADWRKMGFSDEGSKRLSTCAPSEEDLLLWTRQLTEGRRNTIQANRRDATALAYLTSLNRAFKDMGINARACLITRAVTLLRTKRSLKASGSDDVNDCLRHSRLVVTSAEGAQGEMPVGDRTLSALRSALKAYDQRLAIHPAVDSPAPESEAKELLSAWNAFEDARLTIDFAKESPQGRYVSLPPPKGLVERQWQELAKWLQSDDDVSIIVEQGLQRQVAYFKAAMMARDAVAAEEAPVWVFDIPESDSRRVQAIEVNGLGPLELRKQFFGPEGVFRFSREPVSEDVSEDFLALAFAQGCQKQWTLARFYARQASNSALLTERHAVRLEAKLLQAQLLRAGGPLRSIDPNGSDKSERIAMATELLSSRKGGRLADPRAEAEWWALQLERLLDVRSSGTGTGPELLSGARAVRQLLDREDHPPEVRIRLQELLLAFVLAGLRKWKNASVIDESTCRILLDSVVACHLEFTRHMDILRRGHGIDELPQFTRAIEIIGYDLPRRLAMYIDSGTAEESDIPAALLFDVVTLQSQLTLHVDEAAQLVAAELVRLIDRTRGRREFQIVYAPVADRAEVCKLFQSLPDESARAAAVRANDILHDLGNSQLFLEGHESEKVKIAEGIRLFDTALSMPKIDDGLRYHLEIEITYLKMLAALAQHEGARHAALAEVARSYQALVKRYPQSAVLHYRLSVVMGDLGDDEAEFDAIDQAMSLVSKDTRLNLDHWFRSVVRRRLALRFSSKATEMRDRLKDENDETGREHYLQLMARAYQLVSEGTSPSRMGATYVDRLEARRRLNNQIYYAALYMCGGGNIESLVNMNRERFLDLVRQLHPDCEIHEVPEIRIAHTIGLAYSAVGEFRSAAEAGDRVIHLIAHSGDNAESEVTRQMLNDSFAWVRSGQDTAPMALQP